VSVELVLRGTKIALRYVRGETPGLLCDGVEAECIPLDGGRHEAVCYNVVASFG
jgi:hypothetical protein